PPDDGLSGNIENLAFSADGKEIFAWSGYRFAQWDVATRKRKEIKDEGIFHTRQVCATQKGIRTIGDRSYRPPYEVILRNPITDQSVRTIRWGDCQEFWIGDYISPHTIRWADSADEKNLNIALGGYTLTPNGKTLLMAYPDVSGKQNTFVTACDVISSK